MLLSREYKNPCGVSAPRGMAEPLGRSDVDSIPPSKHCPKCHQHIPRAEYGKANYCKPCSSAYQREQRQLHPERYRQVEKNRNARLREAHTTGAVDISGTKRCPGCHQELPKTEYGSNVTSHDGLSNYCRACIRSMRRNEYHKNVQLPEWAEKERERNRLRMAQKRADPIFTAAEHQKDREYKRRIYAADPNVGKQQRAYRKYKYNSDPEFKAKVRANNQRRAHAQRGTVSTLTHDEWKRIIQTQGGKCACCKVVFSATTRATRDHVIPVAMGGGLTFENVQALCQSCNSRKSTRAIDYRDNNA